MLHLIPAPLYRSALRVVHQVRLVWWKLRGRTPDDCRVVALDATDRVLLVRHSYGSGEWMLPGGGAKRGEGPVATAMRELSEETGCTLIDPIEVGRPPADGQRRLFTVIGRAEGAPRADMREIVAVRFFGADVLPQGVSPWLAPRIRRAIIAWREANGHLPL